MMVGDYQKWERLEAMVGIVQRLIQRLNLSVGVIRWGF